MESESENIVKASFNVEAIFKIPQNLDLEDITIVESWWVRNGKLHIRFRQPSEGKDDVLEIEPFIEPKIDMKNAKDVEIIKGYEI